MVLSHNKHGIEAAMRLEVLRLIAGGEVITFVTAWVITVVVNTVMW